jgi:hypothetical protein
MKADKASLMSMYRSKQTPHPQSTRHVAGRVHIPSTFALRASKGGANPNLPLHCGLPRTETYSGEPATHIHLKPESFLPASKAFQRCYCNSRSRPKSLLGCCSLPPSAQDSQEFTALLIPSFGFPIVTDSDAPSRPSQPCLLAGRGPPPEL